MKKIKDKGLLFATFMVIVLGIVIYSMIDTISNTEIPEDKVESYNPFMTVVIVWIVVPCIAVPIGIIINWERFKKLYLNKKEAGKNL